MNVLKNTALWEIGLIEIGIISISLWHTGLQTKFPIVIENRTVKTFTIISSKIDSQIKRGLKYINMIVSFHTQALADLVFLILREDLK